MGRLEEREGASRRPSRVGGWSIESDAANFSVEPTGAEGGKRGVLAGTRVRHGRSDRADREGRAAVDFGGGSAFGEPQQHEARGTSARSCKLWRAKTASNEPTLERRPHPPGRRRSRPGPGAGSLKKGSKGRGPALARGLSEPSGWGDSAIHDRSRLIQCQGPSGTGRGSRSRNRAADSGVFVDLWLRMGSDERDLPADALLTDCRRMADRAKLLPVRWRSREGRAKDGWLRRSARALRDRSIEILDANARDGRGRPRSGPEPGGDRPASRSMTSGWRPSRRAWTRSRACPIHRRGDHIESAAQRARGLPDSRPAGRDLHDLREPAQRHR